MKHQQFKVDQRVWQYDPDDGEKVIGIVVEVKPSSVVIKWDDLSTPCEHFTDEYDKIHNSNANS